MLSRLTLTAALLASASCAVNRTPAPTAASHPPAIDLVCPSEPSALSDEQVIADTDGSAERAFDDAVLLAGRACRDALKRVCEWHKARGAADLKCDTAAMSDGQIEQLRQALLERIAFETCGPEGTVDWDENPAAPPPHCNRNGWNGKEYLDAHA